MQYCTRQPVYQVYSCLNTYAPKFYRNSPLKPNSSSNFQVYICTSFQQFLLLKSIGATGLMYNS